MKWNIFIAVIVLAAAFGIGILVADREDGTEPLVTPQASADVSPAPATAAAATRTPAIHRVRLTASGPVPRDLTIRTGDLVVMVSEVDGYWPASDPHPTHTLCPGFDAQRSLSFGDEYSVPFPLARTCTYHDHLHPSDSARQGSITVQ